MPLHTKVKAGEMVRIGGARVIADRNVTLTVCDPAQVEKHQNGEWKPIGRVARDLVQQAGGERDG